MGFKYIYKKYAPAIRMNKILIIFIFFTIVPNAVWAQTVRKSLKAKVIADANDLDGVYVINLKTQEGTLTQGGGYFSIPVAVGDTLMLSSIQFRGLKMAIAETDFKLSLRLVKMQPLMHQLDEVMVFQYKNINAVALGITPAGQKSYTAAERKLRTATNLDAQFGLNTSLTIDPLLNLFSGRSAMLRKELVVERKQTILEQMASMFEQEYFTAKLKIPTEYVKGFQYYLVENNRFVAMINAKNKAMAIFIMGDLAARYLEIIACEKN